MCECARASLLVVFTKVKTLLLPLHFLLSSVSVTDVLGLVGAILNEWAQMLRVGGQHARSLSLMSLHARQLQLIPGCMLALLDYSQGCKIKIF